MAAVRTARVFSAALVVTAGLACRRVAPPPPAPPETPVLPRLALSPEQAAAVARIELDRPDDDDPTRRSTIVLERRGGAWLVTAPVRARASTDKVTSLLANLQDLRLSKRLDSGGDFYEHFDLTDAKALHVVARTAANQLVVDFLAGKGSEQGQLVRLPGVPGFFALSNEGPHAYQGFLFTRDLRSWREAALLSFEEADVEGVEIENRHGSFRFRRATGDPAPGTGGWIGTFAPRHSDGRSGAVRPAWPRFDGSRVEEMLHAYHALTADDFGMPADLANAGVDDAERGGGVVRIHLVHAPRPLVLRVGAPAPTRSRFSIAGGRWAVVGESAAERADDEAPYVLSPWTARWATGDARSFERAP